MADYTLSAELTADAQPWIDGFARAQQAMAALHETVSGRLSDMTGAAGAAADSIVSSSAPVFSYLESRLAQISAQAAGVTRQLAALGQADTGTKQAGGVPQLAGGTNDFSGGLARINEGGRGELAFLPSGTQVVPHDISMRYARETGRRVAARPRQQVSLTAADIQTAVAKGMAGVVVENVTKLDGKVLSRQLAGPINRELGRLALRAERG